MGLPLPMEAQGFLKVLLNSFENVIDSTFPWFLSKGFFYVSWEVCTLGTWYKSLYSQHWKQKGSFLATIKTIAFCQRDVSTHPENKHVTTSKTLKSCGVWKLHKIHAVFKEPLKILFLAISHLIVFLELCCWQKKTWLKNDLCCLWKFTQSCWFHTVSNLSVSWWVVSWRNLATIHLKPSNLTQQLSSPEIIWVKLELYTFSLFFLELGAWCWYL